MPRLTIAALAFAAIAAIASGNDAERVQSGDVICPHCQLQRADLTNACAKHGNFNGADFSFAQASLMCMSYADLRGANFRNTDLSGANLSFAQLDGANFSGATMTATLLKGSDLRRAGGLTQKQISAACGDETTRLPAGLTVHHC